MDDGGIVMHEDKDDLLSRWKWIHFKDGALPQAIEDGLVRVRRLPFGNTSLTGEYPGLREALAAPIAAGDARLENASLEDILLSCIKEV